MPQVRDPKTGRYVSSGGSSMGGAAGTNPRVQKAKAVGGGATAGGASTTQMPQQSLKEQFVSSSYDDATVLSQRKFQEAGLDEPFAHDLATSIARDRADKKSEDSGTLMDAKYTTAQKEKLISGAESVFKDLGYNNVAVSVRTVKMAGTRSRLRGGGSTGATYELRWAYKVSK